MKTVKVKVYEYAELNDEAKDKARQWYLDGDVYQWELDSVIEDAANVGLIITALDPMGQGDNEGKFKVGAVNTANRIKNEHGPKCETHQDAVNFLKDLGRLGPEPEDGWTMEQTGQIEDLEKEFCNALVYEYRSMALKGFGYIASEEAVKEAMESNGYTFTKDGKRFG